MKNKKRKPVVPIMFEEKMKKQVELEAKEEGRTFASMVRRIIAEWLVRGNILLFVFLFLGCSNPTASKTTAITWKEVKIYYNPQISPPFDDRIVCGDTTRVLYGDSTDITSFKLFGMWHLIPGVGDTIGLPTEDTVRILTKIPNDTLRSYFLCFSGEGADTLIVTKDTTWILN